MIAPHEAGFGRNGSNSHHRALSCFHDGGIPKRAVIAHESPNNYNGIPLHARSSFNSIRGGSLSRVAVFGPDLPPLRQNPIVKGWCE